MLVATVNGPAPTGFWPKLAPSFWMAVGEAIASPGEVNSWAMNAPFGTIWCTTIVYGPLTVKADGRAGVGVPGGAPLGAGCVGTSHGRLTPFLMAIGPRSRIQLYCTACALNGVPSVNFTPWRRVMVTVLASVLKL